MGVAIRIHVVLSPQIASHKAGQKEPVNLRDRRDGIDRLKFRHRQTGICDGTRKGEVRQEPVEHGGFAKRQLFKGLFLEANEGGWRFKLGQLCGEAIGHRISRPVPRLGKDAGIREVRKRNVTVRLQHTEPANRLNDRLFLPTIGSAAGNIQRAGLIIQQNRLDDGTQIAPGVFPYLGHPVDVAGGRVGGHQALNDAADDERGSAG